MTENTSQPEDVAADHHGDGESAPESPAESAPESPAESAPESPAESAPAAAEIEELRRERDELRDRWLRSAAEFDNFRKRMRRELEETRVLAVAELLRDLLEVLDNFERAVIAMRESSGQEGELENWKSGVDLIHQRFKDILLAQGLERIEVGDAEFDPSLHEAILQIEKEGVAPGRIAEVVQPGYRLRDLVIRPCRVIVAR